MSESAVPTKRRVPPKTAGPAMRGFLRADGRKGIRNYVVVAYLVECAHHVARKIAAPFEDDGVQLIGFPGCYPSAYAHRVMDGLCTHPNVGAVLLVSLGCEEFRRTALRETRSRRSGRPVELLVIQDERRHRARPSRTAAPGSRRASPKLQAADDRADRASPTSSSAPSAAARTGFSGITANPAVGHAFDLLVDAGATLMFEETCELIGCEDHMAGRARPRRSSAREIVAAVREGRHLLPRSRPWQLRRRQHQATGSRRIEEKSLGAYAKSGTRPIGGLIKPGVRPPASRPLSDGHGQRRPGALRHSQHQRHPDGDRDGRQRLPHDRCSRPAPARSSARRSRR